MGHGLEEFEESEKFLTEYREILDKVTIKTMLIAFAWWTQGRFTEARELMTGGDAK